MASSLPFRITIMARNAFRVNLIPGLIIQALALTLVATYYLWPAGKQFWNNWAEFKTGCGISYSFFSTAFFGGIIPGIFMWRQGRLPAGFIVANMIFLCIFWGYRGVEAELLYRLQSWMFGDNNLTGTVISKVMVDQFVYNPFWGAPVIAVVYLWRQNNFSLTATRQNLNRQFFSVYLPGMLISNWLVWIPAVCIIYCMPQVLQIPLANLILCFFVLVIASMKKR